jgi:hypothetical protein
MSTTDRTREFVGTWLRGVPLIQARPRAEFAFSDEQLHARAKQEAALRNAHRRQVFEARARLIEGRPS